MALPDGGAIVAAISRHFSEVRRLIKSNRRVAVMWHRAAGPCLLRRLFRDGMESGGPAPVREAGATYLARWCELLVRYGSPRLRASVGRYGCVLIALLLDPAALDAVTSGL
jgi:hypothetical protein